MENPEVPGPKFETLEGLARESIRNTQEKQGPGPNKAGVTTLASFTGLLPLVHGGKETGNFIC